MGLDATHPDYDLMAPDWTLMRDTYGGEKAIKAKNIVYLPYTSSQKLDGVANTTDLGYTNYLAYLGRAVFHDYVSDAVESYIGLLHQKPAVFELPKKMELMLTSATNKGEGLQNLLRRINEEQLVTGRIGLMMDMPVAPDPSNPMPYIATYTAETIRNWDDSSDGIGRDKLNLVILDETSTERSTDFKWENVEKYRVLEMKSTFVPDPNKSEEENAEASAAFPLTYFTGLFRKRDGYDVGMMRTPTLRGMELEEIPFVMINSKDLLPQPDNPPLIGLANLAIAIYKGEAGYRESLYMQSQDTLVLIGGRIQGVKPEDPVRVGAGARIECDVSGDAKYIGVGSAGLSEQRLSLENDKKRAETKSGQMIAPTGQVESDSTLTTRMAAQTATLNQIAWSGAMGLERILKMAARWMGLNEDEVKVTPNLDFSNFMLEGQALNQLMDAVEKGFPVSDESLHALAVEKGITQKTWEEEKKLIEANRKERAALNKTLGLDANGDVIPPAPAKPPARV